MAPVEKIEVFDTLLRNIEIEGIKGFLYSDIARLLDIKPLTVSYHIGRHNLDINRLTESQVKALKTKLKITRVYGASLIPLRSVGQIIKSCHSERAIKIFDRIWRAFLK